MRHPGNEVSCKREGRHPASCHATTIQQAFSRLTLLRWPLHYNKIQHACEAISGYFVVLARNSLAFKLDYIVMQKRKSNRETCYVDLSRLVKLPAHGMDTFATFLRPLKFLRTFQMHKFVVNPAPRASHLPEEERSWEQSWFVVRQSKRTSRKIGFTARPLDRPCQK